MKQKLFTFLLALVASVSAIYAQSGTCGDNLTWRLSNGTLTISGTCAMENFAFAAPAPWYDYRSSIKSVIISDGVTSIGGWAFADCSSLTSVTIPNSVTNIGDDAFYCTSLTSITIPNSVTSIGDRAFSECSKLTSITIPNSVTSIGNYAFKSCSSLTSINVDSNNPNYCSVDGVLFNKDKTTLVAYPGGKQGAYTIPNSVTSIGRGAFYGCSSLTSVTIPNSVTSIGHYAFNDCSSLTSVTIPNSVTSIGESAFRGCSSLTSVTIGNSVTSIGSYAFSYCTSLTSVTIPNSVTSIGSGAFRGTGIYDNDDNWVNGVLYINNCLIDAKTSISGAYAIKEGTRVIADYAFYKCSSLTSITIPNSMISIGNSAFVGCDNITSITWNAKNCADFSCPLYASSTQITSFDFGDNVKHIPAYLCYGMNKLTSITIPNSVTSIGSYAFSYCTSLTSVTIPNSVTSIGSGAFRGTGIYDNDDNWVNGVLYINNCLIDAKTSISGAYAIKEGTRVIADYAFYKCSSLTSITIPNSMISIGRMAFAYDDALVAINVEQGNRAYSSVDGVLYNRDKTVIIAYPTGKTNNSYTILDGVNTIDSCAFIGNEYLEYINMPKTLICIDYGAFGNCTKLIKIIIPKTVRSIGSHAFYNCASLKKIYNNAIIPQEIDDQTFEKVDILNCELYVMPMAFTNYYNANIWKNFGLIETIEIGGIDIDDSKLEFTTTQKQANVLWAANSKATLYLLSMRRVGSEDTYTFTFDENGYLISSDTNSLDFSKLIYLQNAAYSLTITDFDTDATYVYSFLYKDNEGNILHSESGQFSLDEFPEGIENVQGNEVQSTKVIKDGQVLILRGEKVYTIDGRKVR